MNANETQVGGTHYRNAFQHWDLAHELDLGYFEGQVTKYLTRHRSKNGLQDLDKAEHFARKLLELATAQGRTYRHRFTSSARLLEYQHANGLFTDEMVSIATILTWRTTTDLAYLLTDITRLKERYYGPPAAVVIVAPPADGDMYRDPHFKDEGGADAGYVNQDR